MKTTEKIGTFITFIGTLIVLALASTIEFSDISCLELLVLGMLGFLIMGLGIYIINW